MSTEQESATSLAVAEESSVEPEIPALRETDTSPGTILSPGVYLVELGSERPVSPENLLVALAMMGWDEVLLDQSMPNHSTIAEPMKKAASEPKPSNLWSRSEEEYVSRFRFVARLEDPIQIQESEAIHWLYLQGISLDPFSDLKLEIFPHQLETQGLYEVRFLSRMRAQPTREALSAELVAMGWEPLKLSALKKNMRLPKRPGASVTMWYGLARWKGPMSYIVDEDPLYFEDVVLVR